MSNSRNNLFVKSVYLSGHNDYIRIDSTMEQTSFIFSNI